MKFYKSVKSKFKNWMGVGKNLATSAVEILLGFICMMCYFLQHSSKVFLMLEVFEAAAGYLTSCFLVTTLEAWVVEFLTLLFIY